MTIDHMHYAATPPKKRAKLGQSVLRATSLEWAYFESAFTVLVHLNTVWSIRLTRPLIVGLFSSLL